MNLRRSVAPNAARGQSPTDAWAAARVRGRQELEWRFCPQLAHLSRSAMDRNPVHFGRPLQRLQTVIQDSDPSHLAATRKL